jgi:iron(III) transport system ATP-binding protein
VVDPADARGTHALACRGLTRRFGDVLAVDAVDLEVERASLTALLGPSGCGKSTVLRLVAGLIAPDAGAIAIDGALVAGPRIDVAPERRGVGMVFQDHALFPHLDVERNVAFGLRGPAREVRHRVDEVLELVGLDGLGSRRPGELSGGQAQRVALARALAPRPRLVLLDEPFSSLDAALRESVREEVRTILHAAEQTALFVTHDQEEALSLADRVAVMHEGRIHQVAPPRELYASPATRFVAGFVGDADVLPGRRAGTYLVDTPIGRLATRAALEGTIHEVVVRPEQVRLRPDPSAAARIDAVAYLGHDQLVRVRLDDGRIVRSRRPPDLDLERGQTVALSVDGAVLTFPVGDVAGDPGPGSAMVPAR